MEISVKLKGDREIRLKPHQEGSGVGDLDKIEFVPLTGGEVYLTVHLREGQVLIIKQHPEVDEVTEQLTSKIEEWLVEQNPNNQFGAEETEVEQDDETPYDPDKIRVDTKQFSLHQIYEMIRRKDINLAPDFQRNLVWDNQRKSRLIESILMRIPLPMFYFAQDRP